MIVLYVMSLFREGIKQFLGENIVYLYYLDGEGIEQFVAKLLSTYWLLGCWPSHSHMSSLSMRDFIILVSYLQVYPRHCFSLIVRTVTAWIAVELYMQLIARGSHPFACIYWKPIIHVEPVIVRHNDLFTPWHFIIIITFTWFFRVFIVLEMRYISDPWVLFQLGLIFPHVLPGLSQKNAFRVCIMPVLGCPRAQ